MVSIACFEALQDRRKREILRIKTYWTSIYAGGDDGGCQFLLKKCGIVFNNSCNDACVSVYFVMCGDGRYLKLSVNNA